MRLSLYVLLICFQKKIFFKELLLCYNLTNLESTLLFNLWFERLIT
jgi:hypothetical protein